MKNKYPTPVFYVLLPKTGQWSGHYNPVVEDEYLGKGRDAIFDLGMYSHPEGANQAISIYQDILLERKKLYKQLPQKVKTMTFQELIFVNRIIGGLAKDAIKYVRNITDEDQLNSLHINEKNGMNRKTVIRAILSRLTRIHKVSKN